MDATTDTRPDRLRAMTQRMLLSACAGAFSGIVASLFLKAIDWATATRLGNPSIVWGLPIAGLLIGGLYERFGARIARGNDLILDEIHRPAMRTPGRTTPLVFFASTVSHLFGASTGREGVAIQMGASLSDQLSRVFQLSKESRRLLLIAGSAGAFSAVLGAPLAGAVFGMEVLTKRVRFALEHPIECIISAGVAWQITHLFRIEHSLTTSLTSMLPSPDLLEVGGISGLFGLLLAAAIVGVACGAAVRVFFLATDAMNELFRSFFASPAARGFIGGLAVIGLVQVFGNSQSLGLGIEAIQKAFEFSSPVSLPFEKLAMTAVSIGTGFKGGEFIPLVFIGATLASSLAPALSFLGAAVSVPYASACGMVATYGAAARVPFALSLYAAQIFSPVMFPFAFLACFAARFAAGKHHSIFSSQKE